MVAKPPQGIELSAARIEIHDEGAGSSLQSPDQGHQVY